MHVTLLSSEVMLQEEHHNDDSGPLFSCYYPQEQPHPSELSAAVLTAPTLVTELAVAQSQYSSTTTTVTIAAAVSSQAPAQAQSETTPEPSYSNFKAQISLDELAGALVEVGVRAGY